MILNYTTRPDSSVEERILSAIAVMPDGCWLWLGNIHKQTGYGRISIRSKRHYAHKLSYETFVGPVPEGKVLDHFFCDEKTCVNPQHLRPETNERNMERERVARAPLTHCKRNHEFTPENTYPASGGGRACRQCALDKAKAKRDAKRTSNDNDPQA